MKHLLNDLSTEEKNRIREQYEGGMSIDTSRFKSLLENKLGDAKPLIVEACKREPLPQRDSEQTNGDDMKYAADAKLVAQTLTSSGVFSIITENDGCGNYLQEQSSKADGYYYYAPLLSKTDPLKVLQVDGSYSLDLWRTTGKIKCLIAMKCGCGNVSTVTLDPSESFDSMLSKIKQTNFIKLK